MSNVDPLDVANREGNIYGRGISGKYKKTLTARIGFIFLGIVFLGIGFGLIIFGLNPDYFESKVARYLCFLGGIIITILGLLMIKNSFGKKNG